MSLLAHGTLSPALTKTVKPPSWWWQFRPQFRAGIFAGRRGPDGRGGRGGGGWLAEAVRGRLRPGEPSLGLVRRARRRLLATLGIAGGTVGLAFRRDGLAEFPVEPLDLLSGGLLSGPGAGELRLGVGQVGLRGRYGVRRALDGLLRFRDLGCPALRLGRGLPGLAFFLLGGEPGGSFFRRLGAPPAGSPLPGGRLLLGRRFLRLVPGRRLRPGR